MAFRFRRKVKTQSNSTVATLRLVTSTALTDGTVGAAYSLAITATGGVVPYSSYSVIAGTLPAGLSLASSGGITGTPSTTGISTFSIQVKDSTNSTVSDSYRLEVISSGASAPLSITTSTGLTQGVVNTAYSTGMASTGGVAPYSSYTLIGSLPAGLSFTSTSGLINGTPSTTGVSTFSVEVTDSVGSTARQSFRMNVISSAASTGANAFFDALIAKPEYHRSWTLRNQAQLDSLTKAGVSTNFTYIWPSDTYVTPFDAAKFVHVPKSSVYEQDCIASSQALHFPIGMSTGKILITWDFFYGREFMANMGGLANHKEYQVPDGASTATFSGSIYFETQCRWNIRPTTNDVCLLSHRMYASTFDGVTDFNPYTPTGSSAQVTKTYPLKHSVWSRFWIEMQMAQPSSAFTSWSSFIGTPLTGGPYHMMSAWVADENRDPVRILYQVPWPIRDPYLPDFYFEFNTSGHPSSAGSPSGQSGDIIGYARNVATLRDYALSESDTTVFVKPIR